jgi:hypothetical protein
METSSFFQQLLNTFAFPFKDPQWFRKAVIGFLVGLANYIIPIVPVIILTGYSARIMKRILVEKGEPYLPEWDDWGGLFKDGLKLWGANFLYSLPILLIMFIAFIFLFIGLFSQIFAVISIAAQSGSQTPPAFFSNGFILSMVGFILFFVLLMIASILGIAVSLISQPASAHLIARDEFSAAFRWNELWPIIKAGIGPFLLATVMIMGFTWAYSLAFQIMIYTFIFLFLLPFVMGFVIFFLSIYTYTFSALAYRRTITTMVSAENKKSENSLAPS